MGEKDKPHGHICIPRTFSQSDNLPRGVRLQTACSWSHTRLSAYRFHDTHWPNDNNDSKSELTSYGSKKTGKEGRSIPRARTIQQVSFYSFHVSLWLCCYTLTPSIVKLNWPYSTISKQVKFRQTREYIKNLLVLLLRTCYWDLLLRNMKSNFHNHLLTLT